jgi:flagellar export protein FliJ
MSEAMARTRTFQFETLLRLREQRQKEQERVVASRLRQIQALEFRRDRLNEQISKQAELIRGAMQSREMDIDHLKLGRHWLGHLRRGVLEAQSEILTQRALLAAERASLVQVRKQTQVMDRLKEIHLAEYWAERDRREQLELDELNAIRFARSQSDERNRRR